MDDKKLLALVENIYDAALEPALLVDFLCAMGQEIGADSGSIFIQDLRNKTAICIGAYNRESAYMRAYETHYSSINPYRESIETFNGPYLSHLALSEQELISTEFYNDYYKKQNIHYHCGALFLRSRKSVVHLDLQRSKKNGPFDCTATSAIGTILPHLKRSLQILRCFSKFKTERGVQLELLERLPFGAILIDEAAKPSHLNSRAEEIARAGDGLRVTGDGLAAKEQQETETLCRLIHEAVETGRGRGMEPGGEMFLSRDGGGPPLHIVVTPLRTEHTDLLWSGRRSCAVVFLHEPDRRASLPSAAFGAFYGLTPAEGRLAAEVAEGRSLEEIAQRHEISKETARNQLKAVFAKTDTHRQAELAALLLSGPAGFVREN